MTFSGAFGNVFRPAFDQGLAAAATSWWLSGGIAAANAVAVYQPIGAASLAASYVNLAQPGTYNAALGVAPTWASATGWAFDGATQYLTTGVVPAAGWSVIVRLSDGQTVYDGAGGRIVIGSQGADNTRLYIRTVVLSGVYKLTWGYGNYGTATGSAVSTGVMANCAGQGYIDGVADGLQNGVWSGVSANAFAIGAHFNGFPTLYWYGKVQAVAIYNTTLSAAQVLAVSTAMALL